MNPVIFRQRTGKVESGVSDSFRTSDYNPSGTVLGKGVVRKEYSVVQVCSLYVCLQVVSVHVLTSIVSVNFVFLIFVVSTVVIILPIYLIPYKYTTL